MKLIEIYEGTLFQAQMVKDLLANEGIESSLKDEVVGTRSGASWSPAGGVRVIISDLDLVKSKMVVDKFESSQK